jgi:hypothetical protein
MRSADLPGEARGKLFRHVELRFDGNVADESLGATPLDPSMAAARVAS